MRIRQKDISVDIGYICKSGGIVVSFGELDDKGNKTCHVRCPECEQLELFKLKTVKHKLARCTKCFTTSGLKKDRFVGQIIGRWSIESCLYKKNEHNYMLYKCVCECGTIRELPTNCLDGRSKSCGCLRSELTKLRYVNFKRKPKKNRNVISKIWRRLVKYIKIRDNHQCLLCDGSFKLTAHHLDGWNWSNKNRYNEENLVLLCDYCHQDFHSKYSKGNNTKEQFLEYIKNYPIDTNQLFMDFNIYKSQIGFVFDKE